MRWRSFLLGVFLKSIVLGGVLCSLLIVIEIVRIDRLERTIIPSRGNEIVTRGAIDTTQYIK